MHKNLMIVGTGSGAGKSITVAALCRIFYKDGLNTVPFKSQNMALNSFVTRDGKEMGRAQVVQAMACNQEPRVFMNPILLKPSADTMSQVIFNGKARGTMKWQEYIKLKDEEFTVAVKELYRDEIEANYDMCVLEGAGSPVEINLTYNDIVNVGMAEIANAPLVLVADIDKGGVFASILGTVMLMPENERRMLRGVIINKFRGDIEVLRPGIKKIEEMTGIPVIGVIPYFNVDIEDEDGTGSIQFQRGNEKKDINIGVVMNKHISNYNDIDPFNMYSDVKVTYINSKSDFGDEDLIIIPGSKNTIEDLVDLRNKGITEEIIRANRRGVPIVGVCGGLQMLGDLIEDPYGIETDLGSVSGLGILPTITVMEREKNTTQFLGKTSNIDDGMFSFAKDMTIKGYEIHQGVTTCRDSNITTISHGNVFGTYIHGIFDNREFTDGLLNVLRERRGLEKYSSLITFEEYRIGEYDKLEKIFRDNLDMNKLYEIVNSKDKWR